MQFTEMLLSETVTPMLSDDYKERFKAEYFQLKIRTNKLKDFVLKIEGAITSDTEQPKHDCPLGVLESQLNCMQAYLLILESRAKYENINL